MEIGFRHIFLTCLVLQGLILVTPVCAEVPSLDQLRDIESVIQPDVARTEFDESVIESGDYELVLSGGVLSVEDFGSNLVLGIKFNYHISEDFFAGLEFGQSRAGLTSYETLTAGAPLLTDQQRVFQYYLFNFGYNILPGEAYMTDNVTYNTALYLTGGIGVVDFAGDTRLDFAVGAGYRLLLLNFSSVYFEMRDHVFNMDILGESKLTNNLEMTLGYSFYF
jgi:outer membrane beta-barrel protein